MPIRHLDDVKEYFYLFFNMGKRVAILINSDVACRYGGWVCSRFLWSKYCGGPRNLNKISRFVTQLNIFVLLKIEFVTTCQ